MSTIIIPKIKNFFIDEKADMAKHIDKKTQIYMGSERREPCMPGGSSKKSNPCMRARKASRSLSSKMMFWSGIKRLGGRWINGLVDKQLLKSFEKIS